MLFAIYIFIASILLGIMAAYLFLQFFHKKNAKNYDPLIPKPEATPRSSKKKKKK
jgi:hypothetical protein